MKAALVALAGLICLAATEVSAQIIDLNGQYRCVQGCITGLIGQPAFVAQTGTEMRLTNEAGETSRAWIDWPGHIWAQYWNEGAVYSPDGLTIHFDRGTIWQREAVLVVPGTPVAPPPQVYVPTVPRGVPGGGTAYDGAWDVAISTQSGGCDSGVQAGVRITNGIIYNEGGAMVNLQGRVGPDGGVQVSVSAGSQHASGEGRLSPVSGSGTWQGQGNAGYCAGVWQATRRG